MIKPTAHHAARDVLADHGPIYGDPARLGPCRGFSYKLGQIGRDPGLVFRTKAQHSLVVVVVAFRAFRREPHREPAELRILPPALLA
jgi:hypothetical protein